MDFTLPSSLSSCLSPQQLLIAKNAWRCLSWHRCVMLTQATGTGKTYIACALLSCHVSHHLDAAVIAPAHLKHMWLTTLEKFHLNVRVFSYQNGSMGTIPPSSGKDCLWVMDEAHMLKNPATKRYLAIARLTATHKICLITATPIAMSWKDLYALAKLGAFPHEAIFAQPTLVRAFCTALSPHENSHDLTPKFSIQRHTIDIPRPDSDTSLDALIDAVSHISWPVIEPDGAMTHADIVLQVLFSRLLSHPYACLRTLLKLQKYYRACRLQRGNLALTRREFYHCLGIEGTQLLLPFAEHWIGTPIGPQTQNDLQLTLTHIAHAVRLLNDLCAQPDSRVECIRHLLQQLPENRPVILFTQYADTAAWFAKHLNMPQKIAQLTSQKTTFCGFPIDRKIVENMFQTTPIMPQPMADAGYRLPHILICTDAFASGHNFQRANVLIHLDLPWNPAVLKQREGRILRLGQHAKIIDIYRLYHQALPPQLKKYQDALLDKLDQRAHLMAHWQDHLKNTQIFTRILEIRTPIFHPFWGEYQRRWFPISHDDAAPFLSLPPQVATFERAFASMLPIIQKKIAPLWNAFKKQSRRHTTPLSLDDFLHAAYALSLFPNLALDICAPHRTPQEQLQCLSNLPFIPLPAPHTPCRLYTPHHHTP